MSRERRATSIALTSFVYHRAKAPYTCSATGLRVQPVRAKLGIVAARRQMLPHCAEAVAAVVLNGHVTYGARWKCADGSIDAVLLRDAGEAGICRKCGPVGSLPAVYRFFGRAGNLLYVGSSELVGKRVAVHEQSAPWRALIADVTVSDYPTIETACNAEMLAIRTERPEFNVHGRGV